MEPIAPIDPDTLRPHYRAFLQPGRVLLTGHSHQAWPDAARAGLLASFDDAAAGVDDKWDRAFAVAEDVRAAVAARIGGSARDYALGENTHELVVRFLSALDLARRRHVVTTTGEFHTMDRQLRRLAEMGVAVTRVPALPVDTLAERLADAMRDDTAAVMASTVLFETASVVPGLGALSERARRRGVAVLFDAYHAFGVVPFRVEEYGPNAFVVAGGYKYAQWGEGVCFLRVPPEASEMRPVYTGWFAAFGALAEAREVDAGVVYGTHGADRFAGSTYDPASHYRARAVVEFFDAQGLSVERLAASYRRQTERLISRLERWDVRTPREPGARGGFVSVRVPDAQRVVEAMRAQGVWVDARGDFLRFGPAPYVTNDEIDAGLAAFERIAKR